jgi:hypothetical protein
MNLGELAFACYVYASMTDYDRSYKDFRSAINNDLDLLSTQHRQSLITWLNKWGCRQFSKDCHGEASENILRWYEDNENLLPAKDVGLSSISSADLELASEAYAKLTEKMACEKSRGENIIQVTIGPTGAAKILFALRPQTLVPWDDPIRDRFSCDASGQSYYTFHMNMQRAVVELDVQCRVHGIQLQDLPNHLGRPNSSIPKLIDEFNWVSITKSCRFPGDDLLNRWMAWNRT